MFFCLQAWIYLMGTCIGGRSSQAVTQVGKGLGDQVCPNCHQSTYYLCRTCGNCNDCCSCSSNTKRSDTEAGWFAIWRPVSRTNLLAMIMRGSVEMQELLPILRRFTVSWQQNVVLGDHRPQWGNMNAIERFAKGSSKELLKLDSKYSDLWGCWC